MREMRESPQLGSLRLLVRFIILSALLSAGAAALCVLTAALAGRLSPGPAVWAAALAVPAAFGAVTALLAGRYFNRRFRRLRDSFQTIIDGDLSVRLPVEGSGAFSAAYADFNRMAEELQNVRARRDEYVNTFTHEFKTPLTAIRGFAELLQEPGFTEAEQKKYLQIIASESTQLAELANDALLLTKLETGNLPVSRTTFWLDEQVSRCLLLLEGSAREKAQTLTADIAPVEFTGSVELLPHVWNNLVGNAIKYTPSGGHIRVSLQRQGTRRCSPLPTTASACPTRCAATSSTAITRPIRPTPAGASAWACPSSTASSPCAAAASRWRAPPERGAPSASSCPAPGQRRPPGHNPGGLHGKLGLDSAGKAW